MKKLVVLLEQTRFYRKQDSVLKDRISQKQHTHLIFPLWARRASILADAGCVLARRAWLAGKLAFFTRECAFGALFTALATHGVLVDRGGQACIQRLLLCLDFVRACICVLYVARACVRACVSICEDLEFSLFALVARDFVFCWGFGSDRTFATRCCSQLVHEVSFLA